MRDRAQIVISLGEGADGQQLRSVYERAAKRAGVSLSEWARDVLSEAAGVPERVSERAFLIKLGLRVSELEQQVAKLTRDAGLPPGMGDGT